ncbi:MAG: hypothetical protein HKN87_19935 [Saprospiraceae bacterium]|nr:hypothetical protein [Saprospiraceae bacterium]
MKTRDDPQSFAPLLIRASFTGALIMGSISIFEDFVQNWFRRRQFIYLVLVRSFCYTIIISFWLTITNSIWFFIKNPTYFWEELAFYFTDEMYYVNLISVFLTAILATGLSEINSLHGKGPLWNFVLGRYHTPREVELIFCFIDLKGSTTIAEKLGHLQFAMFLRDFFFGYH